MKDEASYGGKYKSKKAANSSNKVVKVTKKPAVSEEEAKKLVDELTLMGFPPEYAKKAIETSNSNVLEVLIDLILKDMQSNPPIQKLPEKKEYTAYSCEICTFNNDNNPGPFC